MDCNGSISIINIPKKEIMGKIFDFIMTGGNWEETQRIALYKKLGKKVEEDEEIKKLISK